MVIKINTKRAFSSTDKNIRFPVTEVLLCAAVGQLAQ